MRKTIPNTPSAFVVLRSTYLNGVLIEKDRFIAIKDTRESADNLVSVLNTQPLSGLDGFTFGFYSKAAI